MMYVLMRVVLNRVGREINMIYIFFIIVVVECF